MLGRTTSSAITNVELGFFIFCGIFGPLNFSPFPRLPTPAVLIPFVFPFQRGEKMSNIVFCLFLFLSCVCFSFFFVLDSISSCRGKRQLGNSEPRRPGHFSS